MTIAATTVPEPARAIPVVDEADVVAIGAGQAGIAAATAAARLGVSVLLVERSGYLGGAASGRLVLVWDDCDDGTQKTVGGCLVTGQAAGAAAALAIRKSVRPAEVDVPALQDALVGQGVLL